MNYWAQRLGMMALLLVAVSMLTFAAMSFLGDPLFNILGPIAGDTETPENIALQEEAKEQYYLDRPLPERARQAAEAAAAELSRCIFHFSFCILHSSNGIWTQRR